MISIEITNCGNDELEGEHRFYKNILRLGGKGSDLILSQDDHWIITLEVKEEKIWVFRHIRFDSFHLNGKRTEESVTLLPGDKIGWADVLLELKEFKFQEWTNKNDLIKENMKAVPVEFRKIILKMKEDLQKCKEKN